MVSGKILPNLEMYQATMMHRTLGSATLAVLDLESEHVLCLCCDVLDSNFLFLLLRT